MFNKAYSSLVKLTSLSCYNIYRFPKHLTKEHNFKFQNQYMTDDLLIPNHQLERGVVTAMVKSLRENPEADVHFKGIGLLMYHMANEDILDPVLLKRFEQNLFKYKTLFTHRLAFGAFYGFIKLNLNNFYMQEFLEKEFLRFKDKLTIDEVIEISESMNYNTTLTKEYLHGIIKDVVQPIILANYKREVRHNPGYQIRLFYALVKVEYFEEELFDLILKGLINQQKIRKLDTWLELLSTLKQLKQADFPRSLQKQKRHIQNKLNQREDFQWIYNFSEGRYYTMEEMIAKREDYKHPDQRQGLYQLHPLIILYIKQHMLANFKKIALGGGTVEVSKEDADNEKDQELQDLLQERFVQAKIGEYDASEIIGENQIMEMFQVKQQPGGYAGENDIDETESESGDSEDQENLQQQKKAEIKKNVNKQLKKRKGKDSFSKFSQQNDNQPDE